jgi:hypothetical protein
MGARLWQVSKATLILASALIQPLRAQGVPTRGGGERVVATVRVQVPPFFRVEVDPEAADQGGEPKFRVVTNVPALRRGSLTGVEVVGDRVVRYTVTAP